MVAIEKGQGDIQQDQLGVKGGEFLEHPVKFPGAADGIAPPLQVPGHSPCDDLVIFHHKNTIHGPTSLIGKSLPSCDGIVNDGGGCRVCCRHKDITLL